MRILAVIAQRLAVIGDHSEHGGVELRAGAQRRHETAEDAVDRRNLPVIGRSSELPAQIAGRIVRLVRIV